MFFTLLIVGLQLVTILFVAALLIRQAEPGPVGPVGPRGPMGTPGRDGYLSQAGLNETPGLSPSPPITPPTSTNQA